MLMDENNQHHQLESPLEAALRVALNECKAKDAKIEALTAENQALYDSIGEEETKRRGQQPAPDEAQAEEQTALEAENASLTERLAAAISFMDGETSHRKQLQGKLEGKEVEAEALRSAIDDLDYLLTKAKRTIKGMEAGARTLRTDFDNLNHLHDKARSRVEVLEHPNRVLNTRMGKIPSWIQRVWGAQ